MSYVKLTKKKVEQLHHQHTADTLWDTQQAGLGVRVTESGERVYVLKTPRGSRVIAPVEAVSLSQARQKANDAMQQSDKPVRLIRFDALVKEGWLNSVFSGWKTSTQEGARSSLRKHLLPEFGHYPVHQITSCQVLRWFDRLSQVKPGGANRNLDVLRSIFNYALKQGYCHQNPSEGVKQNRKRTITRFLSHEELERFSQALASVSQESEVKACCCQVLRLLLLTGCRISEVTGLQWSWVKGDQWHLPDSKTGPRVVYVGKEAQRFVSSLRTSGRGSDDVFSRLAPYASRNATVSQVWRQVRRLADIEDVRIHDLRHTFASYAVMEGYPLPVISKLLGHQRLSSTLRYTHVSNTHVEQGAEQVGQALTEIVSAAKKERKRTKTKPAKKRDEILTDEQIRQIRYELDFLDNF